MPKEAFAYDDKEYNYHAADVYHWQDGYFSEREGTAIPLKTISWKGVELVQQDEAIKAAISTHGEDTPQVECIFSSETLAFELPKGNLESRPIDYDIPGLLLGLSDAQGKLRTLFIRKENGVLRSNEYAGQIVFPRRGRLFALQCYTYEKDLMDEWNGEENRVGALNIRKLLCGPLGVDQTEKFKKMLGLNPGYNYYDLIDAPLYVGPEYVCYTQREYQSGGSWHASVNSVRFDKLDDLSKFKQAAQANDDYITRLEPTFKETTLADYIFGARAKNLYQPDPFTWAGNPIVDFCQLAIKRNIGKWSLMLPVFEEGMHPGNGSYGNGIKDFAVFSNDVPVTLATNSGAMELSGGWNTWEAKDLFQFPGGECFAEQYEYFLRIGTETKENDWRVDVSYVLDIPIGYDEYIVSINFASNENECHTWDSCLIC